MDVELREALNHGFGPEPAHRPLTDRLDASHSSRGLAALEKALASADL